MKKIALTLSIVLVLCITVGCAKRAPVKPAANTGAVAAAKDSRAPTKPIADKKIAVLTLDGNLSGQTPAQKRELDIVIKWMDRDIIRQFKRAGFNAVLIKSKQAYKSAMGPLLIIDVANFNPGSRAARAFVGFGAGAASLDLNYTLLDPNGAVLDKWSDGAGSSKGGTYCAQALDRRALKRIRGLSR